MSEPLQATASSLDEMADLIATSISRELFPTRVSDVDFRTEVSEHVRCAVRTIAAIGEGRTGIVPAVRAHEEATALLRLGGDLRRRDLVAEILADDAVTCSADLDTALGYRLADVHLAVVIGTSDRDRADDVLRRAQGATGAANRLLVPLDPPGWTAWLGSPDRIDVRALRAVLAGSGLRTAVGGPRRGVDGFRRAHAEAHRAEGLRALLAVADDSLVFADFALDSLLLQDVEAASAFADDQLGELAADTVRAERMRETLLAWLSTGSQTTAAARLGIHLNSLRLRLATVTEALGPDYLDHRTEILVALRIRRALGRGTSPVDGP